MLGRRIYTAFGNRFPLSPHAIAGRSVKERYPIRGSWKSACTYNFFSCASSIGGIAAEYTTVLFLPFLNICQITEMSRIFNILGMQTA